MMFAAASGRAEVIAALLEKGADPSMSAKVVDIVTRDQEDAMERRERTKRIARLRAAEKASQREPEPEKPSSEPAKEPEDRDERSGVEANPYL